MLPNANLARGKADRAAKAALTEDLEARFSPERFLAALVRDRGILSAPALFALSQMEKSAFDEIAARLSGAPDEYGLLEFGKTRNFIAKETFEAARTLTRRTLEKFHGQYPELAGLDAEKLSASLESITGETRLSGADCKGLLALLAYKNAIEPVNTAGPQGRTCYRLAGFQPSLDSKVTSLLERVRDETAAAGFTLLKQAELEEKLKLPAVDIKRAAAYLREHDELWLIGEGFLLPARTRDKLLAALSSMETEITVGSLRDAIGVNRKLALSMLDFLDSQGLTRREGDTRTLVKTPAPAVPPAH